MNKNHLLACPSCSLADEARSVASIHYEGKITGDGTENINLQTKLSKIFSPPTDPYSIENVIMSLFGLIFTIMVFYIFILLWILQKIGGSKDPLIEKDYWEKNWSKEYYEVAFERWKNSFYCRRCHIVYDRNTGEITDPDYFNEFLYRDSKK